jgi:hypothetical protein
LLVLDKDSYTGRLLVLFPWIYVAFQRTKPYASRANQVTRLAQIKGETSWLHLCMEECHVLRSKKLLAASLVLLHHIKILFFK